jgi:hypothetical protein
VRSRDFRRWLLPLTVAVLMLSGCAVSTTSAPSSTSAQQSVVSPAPTAPAGAALAALQSLPVKGRAPMTGYARSEFGAAWTDTSDAPWSADGLSTREDVLSRDLTTIVCKYLPPRSAAGRCVVRSGVLHDPYTGKTIDFTRGVRTSQAVQIDHVVSVAV